LTWIESLRKIFNLAGFDIKELIADTKEVLQLTDPSAKGLAQPVRKSRNMMKTINMTIYAQKKKKSKLGKSDAFGEEEN
jgi:hypothetical protein